MNDRYTRVTAPAGFDGQGTRRDYYFKTRNAAREFRLRIKRWKAEQKSPADTLSFDDSDKRWLAYLRAHVGNLELLPAIVTHWERTAKPITRPLKVEELCKAFVLYRQSKGLDKATLSEDRYISKRLQKHLGGYMAHELGIAEIRSFLDTAKTSDSLEHKLYKVGSLIFAYGREQRALVLNPFDDIDRPRGRPRTTNLRAVVNAIFYLLRTSCQWRLLPREFPPWGTVYHCFRSWDDAGVWVQVGRARYTS